MDGYDPNSLNIYNRNNKKIGFWFLLLEWMMDMHPHFCKQELSSLLRPLLRRQHF